MRFLKSGFLALAGATILTAAGCGDASQNVPPGTSLSDPTGVNAKNAAAGAGGGPTPEQVKSSEAIGKNAKSFGEDMNRKYSGR
jgi:hypothetical protein